MFTSFPIIAALLGPGWVERPLLILFGVATGAYVYVGLALIYNRTVITAVPGRIEIRQTPLPCRWKKVFTFEHLREVRVDEWVKRRHRGQVDVIEVQARFDNGTLWVTLVEPRSSRDAHALAGALDQYMVSRVRLSE